MDFCLPWSDVNNNKSSNISPSHWQCTVTICPKFVIPPLFFPLVLYRAKPYSYQTTVSKEQRTLTPSLFLFLLQILPFLQCCYYQTRRKYTYENSADYKVKYHYNLATGIDAGMPLNHRRREEDLAAWKQAKTSKSLITQYRKFRPPSSEQGSCGCGSKEKCEGCVICAGGRLEESFKLQLKVMTHDKGVILLSW